MGVIVWGVGVINVIKAINWVIVLIRIIGVTVLIRGIGVRGFHWRSLGSLS